MSDDDLDLLEGQQDDADDEVQLLRQLADGLSAAAITTRSIGSAEDVEARAAAADLMVARSEALRNDFTTLHDVEDSDLEPIREIKPDLFATVSAKRDEMLERQAAVQARIDEDNRVAALNEEQRAQELAAIQDQAAYEDRVRAANEVIETANREGVRAVHPITQQVVTVHERLPEPLKPTVETFHKWRLAQGAERTKIWESLSETEQDLLSVHYGIRGPVGADELQSLKGDE